MTNSMALVLRMKKLGVLMRDARLKKEKSLLEAALAMGVSEAVFQAYEEGEKSPSLPELENYACFLDVPLEQFWMNRVLPVQGNPAMSNAVEYIALRQRIIGVLLRQARLRANLSQFDLAAQSGLLVEQIEAFEMGEKAVPVPVLETLCDILQCSTGLFLTHQGRIGDWLAQQSEQKAIQALPPEIRSFIRSRDHGAFIVLAKYLSELPPEKLEQFAEYLLTAARQMKNPV